MNKVKFVLFSAGISLALAFTFSCSSDSGDDGGSTHNSSQLASSSSLTVVSSSSSTGSNSGGGDKGNNISSYRTTRIGDQVWMAEDLDYNVTGSVCCDNNPANCNKYGRLYDWATAMALQSSCNSSVCASQISAKHRGICPSGWHIPSDADWNVLMKFANPSCSDNRVCASAGKKLKATSGWNDYNGISGNGTDDFGFSALPNGGSALSCFSYTIGSVGSWWSSTESGNGAYNRKMSSRNEDVSYDHNDRSELFGVRCVQD